jgi:hypothetical protein
MTILVGALALLASACGGDITEDEFIEQLTEDGQITDEQAQCIVDGLGEAGISLQSVTDEELGDGPLPAGAAAVVSECMFASLGLDSEPVDPASLSEEGVGDPTLDALYEACEGGDGQACDDLYFQSPIGSRYENFGDTCGNRFELAPGTCVGVELN